MNLIEKSLVRRVVKPRIVTDEPGMCVMQMGALNLLPLDAGPYMHYVNDALALLPWVRSSETDKSGRITVYFDETRGNGDTLKRWLETAVEEAIRMTDEMNVRAVSEEEIVNGELKRLKPLVSKFS